MLKFFEGKKVLVTGHTGFKGTWLCKILIDAKAEVTGYALETTGNENLFELSGIKDKMNSIIGDIRDLSHLKKIFHQVQPEIVLHLAAQPIVRESYHNPVYTYETNVMGTVNVCECVRLNSCVKSFLNVTTDKVYLNREWEWGYRENEVLNGYDPYSNSKSCSELVTQSYIRAFFQGENVAVSTARAGNVIGGGDFAKDRIIPDCVRAIQQKEKVVVRNPYSIRPYQHVLEPLCAYLMIVQKQYEDRRYAGFYNVGPREEDCISTGKLVEMFCAKWDDDITWEHHLSEGPHEANYLKLDCSKIKRTIGWYPKWTVETAVEKVIQWTKVYLQSGKISKEMERQIEEYFKKWEV